MLYWAVDESRKITVKKYKSGPCKYFVHVPVTLSCCSSGVWGAARRQFAPCQHTSSSERGWEWQPAGKKEDAWLKFPICLLSHVSLQVWVCMQVYNMSVLIALWHADWNNMLTRKQQKNLRVYEGLSVAITWVLYPDLIHLGIIHVWFTPSINMHHRHHPGNQIALPQWNANNYARCNTLPSYLMQKVYFHQSFERFVISVGMEPRMKLISTLQVINWPLTARASGF